MSSFQRARSRRGNRNSISKVFLVPASSLTFEGGEAGHSAVDHVQKVQLKLCTQFLIDTVPNFAEFAKKKRKTVEFVHLKNFSI